MNYHNITHDDMNNGDGLRVVLWVSGCEHHCKGCQNPVTWNVNDGLRFNSKTMLELMRELDKDYVSGITFSGGDPLLKDNIQTVLNVMFLVKRYYPRKTIWVYTGYTWEEITADRFKSSVLRYTDVIVDGKFVERLKDINYPWAGSTNQRVIDVQKSLQKGEIVPYESH